jgi:hypothetical protein
VDEVENGIGAARRKPAPIEANVTVARYDRFARRVREQRRKERRFARTPEAPARRTY